MCHFTGLIFQGFQTKFCLRTYHFPHVYNVPHASLVYWFHYRTITTLHGQYKLCISWFSLPSFPHLTKRNREMPVSFCKHFFIVILCQSRDRMEQALEYTGHTSAPCYALNTFRFLVGLFKFSSDWYKLISFHSVSQSFCFVPRAQFPTATVHWHSCCLA
jgi:hypothetical protein